MIAFALVHPRANAGHLGYIPTFLSNNDPRPAREQFDENYISGWQPFEGFKMAPNGDLLYPDDPPTKLLAVGQLRHERIHVYEHAWVAVVQPDGTFEVTRMD